MRHLPADFQSAVVLCGARGNQRLRLMLATFTNAIKDCDGLDIKTATTYLFNAGLLRWERLQHSKKPVPVVTKKSKLATVLHRQRQENEAVQKSRKRKHVSTAATTGRKSVKRQEAQQAVNADKPARVTRVDVVGSLGAGLATSCVAVTRERTRLSNKAWEETASFEAIKILNKASELTEIVEIVRKGDALACVFTGAAVELQFYKFQQTLLTFWNGSPGRQIAFRDMTTGGSWKKCSLSEYWFRRLPEVFHVLDDNSTQSSVTSGNRANMLDSNDGLMLFEPRAVDGDGLWKDVRYTPMHFPAVQDGEHSSLRYDDSGFLLRTVANGGVSLEKETGTFAAIGAHHYVTPATRKQRFATAVFSR